MKEFFETFGIEPSTCTSESLITKGFRSTQPFDDYTKNELALDRIKIIEFFYPPITSDIVLGLIGIFIDFDRIELVKTNKGNLHEYIYVLGENTFTANTRKDALLLMCIYFAEDIVEDVRALFNAD